MKTTLEMPDAIFRRAKAKAAERGIPFRQYVTEAVRDKLEQESKAPAKSWKDLAGRLSHLHEETERINRIIQEESERIDPEDWT